MKKLTDKKLKRVEIFYDFEGAWYRIDVESEDGRTETISRTQIEAFLRLEKVFKDLGEVQKLRDSLVTIFGNAPLVQKP